MSVSDVPHVWRGGEKWECGSRIVVVEVSGHSTVLILGTSEDIAETAAGCEWKCPVLSQNHFHSIRRLWVDSLSRELRIHSHLRIIAIPAHIRLNSSRAHTQNIRTIDPSGR